jgi:hypothetical protein
LEARSNFDTILKMAFDFEKFEAVGSSFEPRITLRSNGSLGFSQGALNRFKLKDGDWWVVLYYDKTRKVIGIKPESDGTLKGAIPLVKRAVVSTSGKTSLNSFVSAKSFMDYYGIDYGSSAGFIAEWYEPGNLIVLDLSKPEPTSKKPEPAEPSPEDTA